MAQRKHAFVVPNSLRCSKASINWPKDSIDGCKCPYAPPLCRSGTHMCVYRDILYIYIYHTPQTHLFRRPRSFLRVHLSVATESNSCVLGQTMKTLPTLLSSHTHWSTIFHTQYKLLRDCDGLAVVYRRQF